MVRAVSLLQSLFVPKHPSRRTLTHHPSICQGNSQTFMVGNGGLGKDLNKLMGFAK